MLNQTVLRSLRALSNTRSVSPSKRHSSRGKKGKATTKKGGKKTHSVGKKTTSRSKSRSGVNLSNQAAPKQYRKKLPEGQKAAEPAATIGKK